MKSCGKPQSHMRRHVIGRHLPEGFMTWVEMSNEVRMKSIVNFATTIQNLLGCKSLDDLITKICKDRLYPDPKKMIIATIDEDRGLMQEFNRWVKKEDLTVTPEVSPPNCVIGSLAPGSVCCKPNRRRACSSKKCQLSGENNWIGRERL